VGFEKKINKIGSLTYQEYPKNPTLKTLSYPNIPFIYLINILTLDQVSFVTEVKRQ
jgi:hypothetical protein